MLDWEVANTAWFSVLFSKKPCKHHHSCKKGIHFTSPRSLKPRNDLGNNNLISLLWSDVKVAVWLTLHVPMRHGKGKAKKPLPWDTTIIPAILSAVSWSLQLSAKGRVNFFIFSRSYCSSARLLCRTRGKYNVENQAKPSSLEQCRLPAAFQWGW